MKVTGDGRSKMWPRRVGYGWSCCRYRSRSIRSVGDFDFEVIGQWLVVVSIRRIVRDVIRILGLYARESICERGTGRRESEAHLIVDVVTIIDAIRGRR